MTASGEPRLITEVAARLAEVPAGGRVLVACSGGPDSAGLLRLVTAARPDVVVWAGHVRHGLRDDAADAAAATAQAAALGLGSVQRRVRVAPGHEGPEAAARHARYAALRRMAADRGAGWLLVAHTADDRAETVLLRLARGTGVRGLAGIPADRDEGWLRVLRPALTLRRAELRAAAGDLPTVADPTNDDPDQRRRRARDEALPALARLSGGGADPVPALARAAAQAQDDADALDAMAARAAAASVRPWGPARAVDLRALAGAPRAIRSRVVRGAVAEVRGGAEGLPAAAVDAALALVPGESRHLPGGVWATAGGGWLGLAPARSGIVARPLPDEGAVRLEELGLDLVVGGEGPAVGPPARRSGPAGTAAAGARRVRGPTPGDRLTVRGRRRRLVDLLGDAGVPRALRPLVPVVADGADAPLWAAGVAVDDHVRRAGSPSSRLRLARALGAGYAALP